MDAFRFFAFKFYKWRRKCNLSAKILPSEIMFQFCRQAPLGLPVDQEEAVFHEWLKVPSLQGKNKNTFITHSLFFSLFFSFFSLSLFSALFTSSYFMN